MRNRHRNMFYSQLVRNLPRFALQLQRRLPAHLSHHFNIHPPHAAAPARPQRFHRRFLHCKPPRIPFILILELLAVRPLLRRIQPLQKSFPLAPNRPAHAIHFCNVHSQPNNHSSPVAQTSVCALPCSVRFSVRHRCPHPNIRYKQTRYCPAMFFFGFAVKFRRLPFPIILAGCPSLRNLLCRVAKPATHFRVQPHRQKSLSRGPSAPPPI